MTCPNPTAFIDGELTRDDAAAFRQHLAGCWFCRENALYGLQISAQLSMFRDLANLEWLRDGIVAQLQEGRGDARRLASVVLTLNGLIAEKMS